MIIKAFRRSISIACRNSNFFSKQTKISQSRFDAIKNHSLHTQYANLNPQHADHTNNRWKVIKDETSIQFLIQQGGFPGCSDIGILINVGTQNQDKTTAGSLSALQTLVHMKPEFADSVKNYEFLNQTGSAIHFNYDVEHSYLGCSFFQEDSDHIVDLILDLALREKNLFTEEYQTTGQLTDMTEQVRHAAFGGLGLGMPKNGLGNVLQNTAFLDFQRNFLTPHGTVIALSNFPDPNTTIAQLKQKIQSRYPQFLKRRKPEPVTSIYKGGIHRVARADWPFFQFAVAFPGCESRSPKMELYNILRVLLGNASSFSSGGPGKGMHSRCTKNLLNKEACIDSASYILTHYEHYGLFGITTSGYHEDAEEVVKVALREMNLLRQPIPEAELQRAKNILVAGIYMNVEKQSDRLEELTRQMHEYRGIKLNEFQDKIRKVTVGDVYSEMNSMFLRPPTFVLKGDQYSRSVWPDHQLTQALLNKKW